MRGSGWEVSEVSVVGRSGRWTRANRWVRDHALGSRRPSAGVARPAAAAAAISGVLVVAAVAAYSLSRPSVEDAAATRSRPVPSYLTPVGRLVEQGTVPGPALSGDLSGIGVPAHAPLPGFGPAAPSTVDIANFVTTRGTLTPAGIATIAMQHGCSAAVAPVATAIAMAESGGNPSAQGDITLMDAVWDWSSGLWQIRGLRAERGTGQLRDSIANQDANRNGAGMVTISSGCADWTPWSTYNRGNYLAYMPIAEQAVGYVDAYYRAHGGTFPPVAPPDPSATIPSYYGGGGASEDQGAGSGSRATGPATSTAAASTTPAPAGGGAPAAGGPASTAQKEPVPVPTRAEATAGPTSTAVAPPPVLPTTALPTLPLPTSVPKLSTPAVPSLTSGLPTLTLPKVPLPGGK